MSKDNQQVQAKATDSATPLWYSLALIVLGFIYLIAEFKFNAYLVDTATLTLTLQEVDDLELFGRTLSGFGLMLLVFGWIKYKSSQKLRTFKKLIGFGLLGFAFMFFGQKALIENLTDASSVDQRKDAQYVTLMKQGLVKDAIRIEGVEYSEAEIQSPQIKTFLNTLGLMAFINGDFIEVIKGSSKAIIKALIDTESDDQLTENYTKFDKERNKVFESWDEYVVANKEYKDATSNTSLVKEANNAWYKVQEPIDDKWLEIKDAKRKFDDKSISITTTNGTNDKGHKEKRLRRNAENARAYLEDFFESYRLCDEEGGSRQEKCKAKVLNVYDKNIRIHAGEYIHWKEFCTVHPDRRGSLRWEPAYTPTKRLNCPGDQDFIANKILEHKGVGKDPRAMFVEKTGYAPEVTYDEFLLSEKVAKEARQGARDEGLELSDTWTPYNDNVFKNAVVSKILLEAKKTFADKSKEVAGESIKPYLSFNEFVNLDIIQDKLKDALDTKDNVDIYLNEKGFYDLVIAPEINKEVDDRNQELAADKNLLANGAVDEDKGKRAVKAVVIPPIAMMFSLFFAVLNMVFITLRIVYLFVPVRKAMQSVLAVAFITVIVLLPLQIDSGLGANSIATYFVNSASESIGDASQGLTWLMNFQPIVYPIGSAL